MFCSVLIEFLLICCIVFVSFSVASLMFVGLVDQAIKNHPKVCGLLNKSLENFFIITDFSLVCHKKG